jgi:hypothetical protein
MKKAMIIAAGGFAAGCAFFAGLVIGNILTKKKLKAKFEEEAELIRKYYKNKEEANDEKPKEPEKPIEPHIEAPEEFEEVLSGYSSSASGEEEAQHIKTNSTEFDNDYEDGLDPFLITCDEYGMFQDPDYVNANLYWRGGNDLYDEDGNLVDIASTIGYGAIDELMKHKDDDPYIYVRNPRIKVDYEVVWDYLTPRNTGSDHDNRVW